MPRLTLAGFADPVTRPRYIIWVGVTTLILIMVAVTAMGVTSTRWFCANGCHKVQDDTITAYDHSYHRKVSCMACHMPVNADPVTFTLHKAEALGELYLTLTNRFELPLNPHSEVAEEMPSGQCTQCHSKNRVITPEDGIIIDHDVHAKNGVSCATCHNRVAHVEDFDLELKHPKTDEPNRKHEDFMKMEACFRCHGLKKDSKAPGTCSACHPKDFELKPESHLVKGFYRRGGPSAGHARLAVQDAKRIEEAKKDGREIVGYCGTCHNKATFCSDCHGLPMPHPKGFGDNHGKMGRERPRACGKCHPSRAGGTDWCNACHHKQWPTDEPWVRSHKRGANADGARACLKCHAPTYCAKCHTSGVTRR